MRPHDSTVAMTLKLTPLPPSPLPKYSPLHRTNSAELSTYDCRTLWAAGDHHLGINSKIFPTLWGHKNILIKTPISVVWWLKKPQKNSIIIVITCHCFNICTKKFSWIFFNCAHIFFTSRSKKICSNSCAHAHKWVSMKKMHLDEIESGACKHDNLSSMQSAHLLHPFSLDKQSDRPIKTES